MHFILQLLLENISVHLKKAIKVKKRWLVLHPGSRHRETDESTGRKGRVFDMSSQMKH